MSDVEQQTRAARNQALFREVNERVESLNEGVSPLVPRSEWICECADTACFEHIHLTMDEYATLRQHAARFAVSPGEAHVFSDVERVVERSERFWVVEKTGTAARVAAELSEPTD
jgi:hypothetical protein